VTCVWLVRHAESESNAGRTSAEPALIPLTARGHEQAALLAARVPAPPALIVTSPYLRARQTAGPTAARFPRVRREEWPVEEFTYLGDLHGRATTATERRPLAEAYWQRADPHLSMGGAESFTRFAGRARACVDRMATLTEGPVVVFTHGEFIRAVLWTVLGLDGGGMRGFRRFADGIAVPNTAVVEVRAGPQPRVVLGAAW
jgi:broad specificity phosphatase PhoE